MSATEDLMTEHALLGRIILVIEAYLAGEKVIVSAG